MVWSSLAYLADIARHVPFQTSSFCAPRSGSLSDVRISLSGPENIFSCHLPWDRYTLHIANVNVMVFRQSRYAHMGITAFVGQLEQVLSCLGLVYRGNVWGVHGLVSLEPCSLDAVLLGNGA